MGKSLKGKELGTGISQRKDGRYQCVFRYEGRQFCVYGATVRECKLAHENRLIELKNNIVGKDSTLNKYFDKWIEQAQDKGDIKGSTIYIYKTLFNKHISPELGNMKMRKIDVKHVNNFQETLRKKTRIVRNERVEYSARTINSVIDLLHLIFETAVKDESVIKNPVLCGHISEKEDSEDNKTERTNNRALTVDEEKTFLKYAADTFYYNMICLLCATGMRLGEARALKWRDIDMTAFVIHIEHTASVDADNAFTINSTKTKSGTRDYPLDDEIVKMLEAQKKQNTELFGSANNPDDFVFLSQKGLPVLRNPVLKAFTRICEKIEKDGIAFDRVSPHSLRHSWVTQSLHIPEVNVFDVQQLVGHSTGKGVTFTTYLGKDNDSLKETAKQIYEFRKKNFYDGMQEAAVKQ